MRAPSARCAKAAHEDHPIEQGLRAWPLGCRQIIVSGGIAALVCLSNRNLAAQDQPPPRGNFDPAQFRQRMMDRYKERLEVKSDDEWKIISERIEKVTQAQRDARLGGFGGFGGGRRGGGPGGDGAQADN